MTTPLIEHNPLLKRPLLKVLSLVEQHPSKERRSIEAQAFEDAEELFLRQSPTTTIDILIRNGALEEQIYIEGSLYEGTLHDIQADASIDEEASLRQELMLTDTGKELLDAYTEGAKLRQLLAEKPHHTEVYLKMLEACSSPKGCSRTELEELLSALPELAPNAATGERHIYPQYFIDSLETAEGIAWRGTWQTTDEGRLVRVK